MKNNTKLQEDVPNAIKWEPSMYAAEIGVTAKDGVTTLTGIVDSYSQKLNVERATKNVIGVKAVAENITVNFANSFRKNDTEIANEVLKAWSDNMHVTEDNIKVKVEDGWLTFEGTVDWYCQKEAPENAINNLYSVKGVTNLIKVKSESNDAIEKKSIKNALMRNWSIASQEVTAHVDQNKVKLTGVVHSMYQKEEAGRLAWNTPGVCAVDNKLEVI